MLCVFNYKTWIYIIQFMIESAFRIKKINGIIWSEEIVKFRAEKRDIGLKKFGEAPCWVDVYNRRE